MTRIFLLLGPCPGSKIRAAHMAGPLGCEFRTTKIQPVVQIGACQCQAAVVPMRIREGDKFHRLESILPGFVKAAAQN